MAGDDGRSTAMWEHFSHEALQHLLVLVIITGEGLQLAFKTYFYSQGQLWVLQANEVTCRRETNVKREVKLEVHSCLRSHLLVGLSAQLVEVWVNVPLYERQTWV